VVLTGMDTEIAQLEVLPMDADVWLIRVVLPPARVGSAIGPEGWLSEVLVWLAGVLVWLAGEKVGVNGLNKWLR
jgi:hypothetical protein